MPLNVAVLPPTAATNVGTLPQGCGECDLQCEDTETVPSAVSDWNTFYHVEIGIEVLNGWNLFNYGSSPSRSATIEDWIAHIRSTFSTVNAAYKRDVGVIIQIKHIRFLVNETVGAEDELVFPFWVSNLPSVDLVYRLVPSSMASGGGGLPHTLTAQCGLNGVLLGGRANYNLLANPKTQNSNWKGLTNTLGHEMSHMFSGRHTDFYVPIIEHCNGGCYTGAPACPSPSQMSWSGLCRFNCANPGLQRFGPLFGPMARVIRDNILNDMPPGCLQSGAVFSGSRTTDTDGDEFPNDLDNCPNVVNPTQEDFNQDGIGDECAPCTGACTPGSRVTILDQMASFPIVFGNQPLSNCPSLDENGNGKATVRELVRQDRNIPYWLPCLYPDGDTGSGAGAAKTVTVGTSAGDRGGTATITVNVSSPPGATNVWAGMQMDIVYDTAKLSLDPDVHCQQDARFPTTDGFGVFFQAANVTSPPPPTGKKRLRVLLFESAVLHEGQGWTDGPAFSCTFNLASNAPLGNAALTPEAIEVIEDDTDLVSTTGAPGYITICSGCQCS